VTHDQAEAMSMADQVILMRDGRIEQDATPDEMYARPASTFAARFIGTPPMNVVAGATLANASPYWSQALGDRAAEIAVGIRPEDIRLGNDGVDASIAAIEYLGADSVMTCIVGDQLVAVRAKGKLTGNGGDRVRLAWDRAAMHCFDQAAGHRLSEHIV